MLRTHVFFWAAALSCGILLAQAGHVDAQHHHGHHHHGHHHHGHHHHGHHHHHHGFHHHGHHHHHHRPSWSFGLSYGTYPGYGYYPSYGYGYYPRSYLYAPSYPDVYYLQRQVVPADQLYYQQSPTIAAQPVSNAARFHVTLPDANTEVWIDGRPTTSRGTTRQFETPQLEPGKTYWYTVRISRNQGGQSVTEERQVEVSAGKVSAVDFTQPPPPEKVAAPK